jgi:hypothetical protein
LGAPLSPEVEKAVGRAAARIRAELAEVRRDIARTFRTFNAAAEAFRNEGDAHGD